MIDSLCSGLESQRNSTNSGVVSALAMLGVYYFARGVYRNSKSLAKYCLLARPSIASQSLA